MHFSFVIASSPRRTVGSVLPPPSGGVTVLSSGEHPTNAYPLDVMSAYGEGTPVKVEVGAVVVEVVEDVAGIVDVDRVVLELSPPLGITTNVTFIHLLLGSSTIVKKIQLMSALELRKY